MEEEDDDDEEDIDNFGGEPIDDFPQDEDYEDNGDGRAPIEPPYSPPAVSAVSAVSVGPVYCTVAQYKVSHFISRRVDEQVL